MKASSSEIRDEVDSSTGVYDRATSTALATKDFYRKTHTSIHARQGDREEEVLRKRAGAGREVEVRKLMKGGGRGRQREGPASPHMRTRHPSAAGPARASRASPPSQSGHHPSTRQQQPHCKGREDGVRHRERESRVHSVGNSRAQIQAPQSTSCQSEKLRPQVHQMRAFERVASSKGMHARAQSGKGAGSGSTDLAIFRISLSCAFFTRNT